MKALYEKPEQDYRYNVWFDEGSNRKFWYEAATKIYDYKSAEIPQELKDFLDKWSVKINEYKKSFRERYPVKLAKIEFLYKDVVYVIYPKTVGATYQSTFLSDVPYDVSWDSLFEEYESEIRQDLKKELNVCTTRYWGMLD